MSTFLIYAWLDDDGVPFYVGKSCDLAHRNRCHRSLLNGSTRRSRTHQYNKLRKLIKEGFSWNIDILECEIADRLSADEREKWWIAKFRRQGIDLCNHTDGGDGGDTFSGKTKEQQLAIRRRMSQSQKRRNDTATEEQKEKWAESQRGKKLSKETCRRISEATKGRKFSKSHRKKLSTARRKRVTTDETRRKRSETSRGKINIKRYLMTDPQGNEYITERGLSDFCREHGLTPSNCTKVTSGRRPHHKGWKIKRL